MKNRGQSHYIRSPRFPNQGQAAMEFIMTYGWAILAVLVMIGALAYFGVLNIGKYTPDKCLFGVGFNCKDYQVTYNGGTTKLQFTIENKQGSAIVFQAANVTTVVGANTYTGACGAFPQPASGSVDVDIGYPFSCTFAGANLGVGQPIKVNLIITYNTVTGVYNHTMNGQITTTVQQ